MTAGHDGDRPVGPRDGDRVRARCDTRGREEVEGVLRLRYARGGAAARVHIELDTGALRDVDPESVVVVAPGWAPPSGTVVEMIGGAVLEPVPSLTWLRERGLTRIVRERQGGTWEEMTVRLDRALQPLVDAGWVAGRARSQESWEFGDSVSCDLQRGGEYVAVELYEDDALALWAVDPDDDGDGDVEGDPEVEWGDGAGSLEDLADWYRAVGRLP